MLSRTSRRYGSVMAKRFQHAAPKAAATEEAAFVNKFNFDLAPPQTHKYWNFYNSSVAFGIGITIFFTSDYVYGSYFAATNKEYSLRRPLDK